MSRRASVNVARNDGGETAPNEWPRHDGEMSRIVQSICLAFCRS
jgi:hypothetical protein